MGERIALWVCPEHGAHQSVAVGSSETGQCRVSWIDEDGVRLTCMRQCTPRDYSPADPEPSPVPSPVPVSPEDK